MHFSKQKITPLIFGISCGLLFLTACSGSKVVPVYKPSETNVFRSECPDDKENCYKQAREHCKSDFEVIELGKKYKGESEIITLEFKCI